MTKHEHRQFAGSRNPVARNLHKVCRAKIIPDKRDGQRVLAWWEELEDQFSDSPEPLAHVLPAGAVAGHCPMCHPYASQRSPLHVPVHCEAHSV